MTFFRYIYIFAAVLLFCLQSNSVCAQVMVRVSKGKKVEKLKVEKKDKAVKVDEKKTFFLSRLAFWKKDRNIKPSNKLITYKDTVRKEERQKKENLHRVKVSAGTNLLSWAYYGTANLEANVSFSKHFSAFAGGKYNSLQFTTKAHKEIYNNQITGYAGVKWWPWFVNTGWWAGIKGQYSDFSTTGVRSSYLREGKAVGGGLSGGYSFMMGRHFNLDLGFGVWGGTYLKYTDYEYPEANTKFFFGIDNIIASLVYVF